MKITYLLLRGYFFLKREFSVQLEVADNKESILDVFKNLISPNKEYFAPEIAQPFTICWKKCFQKEKKNYYYIVNQ